MTWICADCGAEHESNQPPCLQCAGETFVRKEEYVESGGPEAGDNAGPRWRCEGCGKVYSSRSPPCSRCGSMQLTNDPDAEIDQGDPTAERVRSRGGLWYASRAVAVVAVVLLLLAGMSVVSGDPVGGQLFNSQPEPIEVAGYDDSYDGVNLTAIEREVAVEINTRRSGGSLEWSSDLHAAAEYHNHRAVENNYRGWARDRDTLEQDVQSFGVDCQAFDGATNQYQPVGGQAYVETGAASEVATAIAENLWQYEETRSGLEGPHSHIAIDLFVTDEKETLLVVYVC